MQPPPMSYPPQPPGYGPPSGPKSGSKVKIILALVIGGGLLCSGVLTLVVWLGLGMVQDDVASQLETHPVLLEHVGTVQEFKMNAMASLDYDDTNIWVYDVQGTLGDCVVKARSISKQDREEVQWAKMELPDGRTFVLVGDPPDRI